MNEPGGWLIDVENFEALEELPQESDVLAMRGHYQETRFDPRTVLHVEQQGNVGACQGHSISSCLEWCYIIETGDVNLQLSRAMGYYESQRLDGITGDNGSTISAGVKLATNTGICEESLWPYVGKYRNTRPNNWSEITTNAAKYKIGQSRKLTTYDGVRTFLGSGQGAVHIGIGWGSGMNASVLERFSPGSGGHSVGLYSLSDRVDGQGQPYIWMMNSWGSSWGNKGWAEWSPYAISQMLQHRFSVFIGVSDMPAVKPRKFNLDDWKKGLQL